MAIPNVYMRTKSQCRSRLYAQKYITYYYYMSTKMAQQHSYALENPNEMWQISVRARAQSICTTSQQAGEPKK